LKRKSQMGRNLNLPVKGLEKRICKSEFLRYSLDGMPEDVELDREDRFEIEVIRIQDYINKYTTDAKQTVIHHIL
jgi:hypothetical protein